MKKPASKKPKKKKRAGLPELKKLALAYPFTEEHHPWGDTVIKVKGKVFIFMGQGDDGGVSFSVKLPVSGGVALLLPFCEPTAYGLGKSGWVSARFPKGVDLPLELITAWLDESFRAIAPKKIVAGLP